VHYFLIVIAVIAGFQAISQRRGRLSGWLLCSAVAVAGGLNVLGSVRNAAIAVSQVNQADLADLNSLVRHLSAMGINRVSVLPGLGLPSAVISYGLRQAGLAANDRRVVGKPLLTDEHTAIAPIADADIALRSAKGKYVLSYTPDTLVEVYGGGGTSIELRDGLPFRWLNTKYEYNVLHFETYFGETAKFLKSLPLKAITYNDFFDSGYYLAIEALLNKHGIRHSDDPRECEYFLRLNRSISDVKAKLERNRNSSAVVVPVSQN